MSIKLRYWIQQADFTAKDYDPVDLIEAERLLTDYNWGKARAFMRSLAQARGVDSGEYCEPGIGFVTDAGRLLHICPREEGEALCMYLLLSDVLERRGLEAINVGRSWGGSGLSLLHQFRALQLLYRGDYDGVIRLVEDKLLHGPE
jgi:hypothetical protein